MLEVLLEIHLLLFHDPEPYQIEQDAVTEPLCVMQGLLVPVLLRFYRRVCLAAPPAEIAVSAQTSELGLILGAEVQVLDILLG